MTNKEIISNLRGLIGKYNLTDEEWQTVEKTIKVLSNSDRDAISRNNAITSICQWGTTLEKVGKCQITVAEMKQTCADMLNELPSIQSKPKTDVIDKIRFEIKEWYWQADKQALAKDPCVVDAMIDLFIRTIDKYKAESKE